MEKINKLGVVFGTFAPMQIGHVDLITKAKRLNDHVLVVVSGTNTNRDRGTKIGLNLNKRFRYVREVFTNDNHVTVVSLDEEHIPEMPNGWSEWLSELKNLINPFITNNRTETVNFYVGEKDYVPYLTSLYDDVQNVSVGVELVDRTLINISATQIRENPFKYWQFITLPFRRHFTQKVLLVGSASVGKTTLGQDLARIFNALFSPEYSREYQTVYNVRDDELQANDYVHLIDGQYTQTSHLIDTGQHNGLVIADTNSIITKAYYDYFCGDTASKADKELIEHLYKATVKREDWDLVIFIEPSNTTYVDDGYRNMDMADDNSRQDFANMIKRMLTDEKIDYHIINGDFASNYESAKQLIISELNRNLVVMN